MLTIKYVDTSYGQYVRQAHEVRFASEAKGQQPVAPGEDPMAHFVYADLEGGGSVKYNAGTVYVMNDHGSTVAKYDLGGWDGPSA